MPKLSTALTDVSTDPAGKRLEPLRDIGDPAAAPALVRALEDENFDIRWIAAEGLIAVGQGALTPLLQALVQRPFCRWLQKGGTSRSGFSRQAGLTARNSAAGTCSGWSRPNRPLLCR